MRPVRIPRTEDDARSAWLAKLMDTAFVIPGTKIRFGFDAIIDLIPGVGDAVGALIATVIITHSSHLGVPKIVLVRMAGNVLLNTLVGAVPFLGAVLTVFFRSNAKNYELLRAHASGARKSTVRDWIFVATLLVALLAGLAFLAWGAWALARSIYRGISSDSFGSWPLEGQNAMRKMQSAASDFIRRPT